VQRFEAASRSRRSVGSLAAEFGTYWNRLFRFMLNRRLRSALYQGAPGDLTPAQFQALGLLRDEDLRMGDLAHRLGLAESTVTRLVDRLEAAGFAERRPDRPDRRRVMAGITRNGRRLLDELDASRDAFLAEILSTLEPGERAELVRLFAKVTGALSGHEESVAGGSMAGVSG
jgi:DNA-binding MarR family transcriptional regulator